MAIYNELKPKSKNNCNPFVNFVTNYIPWKGDNFSEVFRKIVFAFSLAVFLIAGKMVLDYTIGNIRSENLNNKLSDMYNIDNMKNPIKNTSETDESSDSTADDNSILPEFAELYKLNSDVVGFINVPNTQISYPVLQSTDNDFYLHNDFLKKKAKAGAIFAEYRTPIKEKGVFPDNLIIYGHNMKAGTQFQNLQLYNGYGHTDGLKFYKENPIIRFDTLYEQSEWVIISCFLTGIYPKHDNGIVFNYHTVYNFTTDEIFDTWHSEIMKRNIFTTDIEANKDDTYLTLSTCGIEFTDSRFVVVARKIRADENLDDLKVNIDEIKYNKDTYYPDYWYRVTKQKNPRLEDSSSSD